MPVSQQTISAVVIRINTILSAKYDPLTLVVAAPGLPNALTATGHVATIVTALNAILARYSITDRVQVVNNASAVPVPTPLSLSLNRTSADTSTPVVATIGGTIPTGAIVQFDDGSPAVAAATTVTHTFVAAGNYVFRILDNTGLAVASRTVTITASPVVVIGVTYDPPITITQGGTYTRAIQSVDNPNTPAILIDTTQPVIIEGSNIRGKGDLIRCRRQNADVTIRNTKGEGLNPNVSGRAQGRFADLQGMKHALVEYNEFTGTIGVYFYELGSQAGAGAIVVRRNRAKDINGQWSDGAGGYLPGDDQFYRGQFVQFNSVHGVSGAVIEDNWISGTPRVGHIEDTINIGNSEGAGASDAIRVRRNLIEGAFAYRPEGRYSGGGILLGDGGGAYQEATDNVVLEASNYGVSVADGNYMLIARNIIYGIGKLDDGTFLDADSDAGIYLRDYKPSTPRIASTVIAEENDVGWGTPSPTGPNNRKDIQVSNDAGGRPLGIERNNTRAAAGPITRAQMNAKRQVFFTRLSASGVHIGLL